MLTQFGATQYVERTSSDHWYWPSICL